LVGIGVFPQLMGFLAEMDLYHTGFIGLGVALVLLVPLSRLHGSGRRHQAG
jgi:hypothetical protein